ncbi:DDE-type integrase/transposase/recombinase [Aquamicrobium lusatiense]|uniref:DDE-type integrase/transposase/recombinase n=1 Tax=Aquamicrobium lusatiense TaxID=89772 RepID=UPI001617F0A8
MVRATVARVVRVWNGRALQVAIADASGLACTESLPDEKKASAAAFLERAFVLFETHGITIERGVTDNGAACECHLFRKALADHGIRHKCTRPYTPAHQRKRRALHPASAEAANNLRTNHGRGLARLPGWATATG